MQLTQREEGTAMPGPIAWETNYVNALAKARREGKPLLVDFFVPG